MIEAKVNGVLFGGFTRATIIDTVDTLCNEYVLRCASAPGEKFPIARGADVDVMIDGFKMIPGKAETVTVDAPENDYSVTVSGRSKLKALLKESLPPKFLLLGPISLRGAIVQFLRETGLDFDVVDEVGDLEDFDADEILTEDLGSSAWDLFLKLAEKRNVLITGNSKNEIVITRANTRKYLKVLKRTIVDDDKTNNIVSSNGETSDAKRMRVYQVASQKNVAVRSSETPPSGNNLYVRPAPEPTEIQKSISDTIASLREVQKDLKVGSERYRVVKNKIDELQGDDYDFKKGTDSMNTSGGVVDLQSPDGVYWETAKDPSDSDECDRLSAKICNNRRIESVKYQCQVVDHLADDEPWESGYLVKVIDEYCDVNAVMSIKKVSWEEALSEDGEAVDKLMLTMTLPEAYGDQTEESPAQKQVTVIGENFQQSDLI